MHITSDDDIHFTIVPARSNRSLCSHSPRYGLASGTFLVLITNFVQLHISVYISEKVLENEMNAAIL